MQHYRCYRFFVPSTGRTRICATAQFFPNGAKTPIASPTDQLFIAANDLITALKSPSQVAGKNIQRDHLVALKALSNIFRKASSVEPHVHAQTEAEAEIKSHQHTQVPTNVPTPQAPSVQTTPGPVTQTPSNPPTRIPVTIPYRAHEVLTPQHRPPTHIYPTRGRNGPHIIDNILETHAMNMVLQEHQQLPPQSFMPLWSMQHYAANTSRKYNAINNVMDDSTGEMQNYRQLIRGKETRERWLLGMCKELGRLSQGYKNFTEGTNTLNFMTREQIRTIPKDRTVTYARIVVDYKPQKEDPFRVRMTVGGNLLKVPGDLSTPTADLITTKLLWNSVLSTADARYACIDIKNMYLQTPMKRKEYMRIPLKLIPPDFIAEYNLLDKVHNEHIYMEIGKGMYGLTQTGKLAHDLLTKRLATCGYIECRSTPGLWRHIFRPVQFTLVVDDF